MRRGRIIVVAVLAAMLLLSVAGRPRAEEPQFRGINIFCGCRVLGVHDGDTYTVVIKTVFCGEVVRRVRLAGVDAPEIKQPWGEQSRDFAAGLLLGKRLCLVPVGKSYGRHTAHVRIGKHGPDLARSLVEAGQAWVNPKYAKGSRLEELQTAQDEAKAAKRGLWSQDAPMAPWEWRKR